MLFTIAAVAASLVVGYRTGRLTQGVLWCRVVLNLGLWGIRRESQFWLRRGAVAEFHDAAAATSQSSCDWTSEGALFFHPFLSLGLG